jgi:signal transduction histidine kinase
VSVPAVRRLYREPGHGRVAGVATGIASHLRVRVGVVRLGFVALSFAGGLGIALYGAYWIVLPAVPGSRRRLPVWLEYVLGGVVALLAVLSIAISVPLAGLFVPTLLACLGGALIWRQASEPERDRWLRFGRDSIGADADDRMGRIRLLAGGALVVLGGALVVGRANFTAFGDVLVAVLVTVAGLVLVTGPWWMRLVTQLGQERAERIRSQERADIAAHLHDSVLQTLALIQRNASSPRDVARLARGQERELRTLLYGSRVTSGELSDELRRLAAEVEDAYVVRVDVVVVGDVAMNERLAAVAAATREAMVNAAKHSGVDAISLYAEAESEAVSVFVKDRGSGFDFEAIADDRQGVRGSIIDRIERHGGEVTLRTTAGEGTEVAIRMPC